MNAEIPYHSDQFTNMEFVMDALGLFAPELQLKTRVCFCKPPARDRQ